MSHYCPQHKARATIIIDTWPGRCGTCCKEAGGPGTPEGGCCPTLWDERSPEALAQPALAGQTFAQALPADAVVVHEDVTYVDPRAWDALVRKIARTLPPGEVIRSDGKRVKRADALNGYRSVRITRD